MSTITFFPYDLKPSKPDRYYIWARSNGKKILIRVDGSIDIDPTEIGLSWWTCIATLEDNLIIISADALRSRRVDPVVY